MTDSMKLAEAVAAQLARHLSDVIICPGSRNAPLSLALLAREDIRVHTRLDERSAAFTALGMARVQRRHVGVVMTSGTAVANALPAMVEAAHSHTPLAVISADRPARLVGTGASQTIQQQGIFGVYAATTQVAEEADIPQVAQRFTSDLQVHINVAFDVPLLHESLPEKPSDHTSRKAPTPRPVNHGEVEVDLSKNTLVIAGDEAWEVQGLEDVPTIAEPTAPAPFHPVHPAAAHIFRRAQVSANDYVVNTKVEQVIVVGHPTLHRGVMALINDPDIELIVLSRSADFTNPRGEQATLGTTVKTTGEPSREWLKICEGAAEMASSGVREVLENKELGFTGLHVAAAVGDTLSVEDILVLGASNPVRDASLVGLPFDGVDTFSPRGAAGIDGTIAQAMGIALATQSREADAWRAPRVIALLGDVTFLHDATSLLVPEDEARPENLTIVVANDDGCGIFELLEQGAEPFRPSFEKAFGTPHGMKLEQVAEAFGAEYRAANTPQKLLDTLAELKEYSTGVTIVEAHTTRETRRQLQAELTAKVGQ
ncbi:2-succinyl-5-enolpyruvyl-6-hydroxy-3-cyclohexene-1-carboxylic-acid synthase [Corynebacterium sp. HMSC06D04]|uniref:2-succinyl-5-enolpyruvyl-6-hydroxy-3- cyclohexene-1-carboxylic-acid synthase n=1 Tax=unclassified Corynebacterium TaxID=2624378 RepID=UPI0008A43B3A|nr:MULTISPECIES: 2-succinyl-5-enolpyruvyl-6-hydroxy-3-cyclohexene-1-carboxylic-acid synthase [unclassified Corynebacterium]OFQ46772.1 2-succinyl-5-enolpyruvyl-6-hydroxy-3-cyclohexene-1-carboxylic-acid synthase [Corynebacterium sp. HMSC076D02]OFR40544.1 2-succinyl-5-enolpyruvyl-6-hydroxy-3-cyclohexene-1-carboxylic-acid synthase [Corynebacterium sp. HMSC077D03]OFT52560.1 2-succinyl-5-enolpyruvyl-6-hydroxy-3-cyclohexene-1-carboxylic-acid synthase [Corynebacterium sp. HMSC06D04]